MQKLPTLFIEIENIMIMQGYKYHRYIAREGKCANYSILTSIVMFLYNSLELIMKVSLIAMVVYGFQLEGKR